MPETSNQAFFCVILGILLYGSHFFRSNIQLPFPSASLSGKGHYVHHLHLRRTDGRNGQGERRVCQDGPWRNGPVHGGEQYRRPPGHQTVRPARVRLSRRIVRGKQMGVRRKRKARYETFHQIAFSHPEKIRHGKQRLPSLESS